MIKIEDRRILVLGWQTKKQQWLTEYPFATISGIYLDKLSWAEKRKKVISAHTSKFIQNIGNLSPSKWYGNWKYNIKNFDTVIIIDEVRGRDIFEFILDKNPNCRVCVFYDAPIIPGSSRAPSHYKDLPIHFFTSDRKIANDYNIIFTPYFYLFSPYNFDTYFSDVDLSKDIKFDVFFIGEEKGDRMEYLDKISNLLDSINLKYEFKLVRKRNGWYFGKKKKKTQSFMSYDDVIEYIKGSRAILELISAGQTGITQRPYETLFFHKKLITSSAEIKSYDFYHPNNVFILNEQELSDLPEFLQIPFVSIKREIVENYTFTGWLKRLCNDNLMEE